MSITRSLSRRRLLGLGAGAVGTTIAGCSGFSGRSGTPTDSTDVVVRGTSFDGPDLVVRLEADHAVSHLNLIGPDGSLFGQTDVAVGATTARIELLDIKPERAGLKHYTPGEHELVAVGESASRSVPLHLEPELRIVDVWQYRDGSKASDYGKLVVEVENAGTGPTWVYSVKYRGAPNFAANDELGGDPGVPILSYPDQPTETIIYPGESSEFVGGAVPILFVNQNEQTCNGEFEMGVFTETAIDGPLEQPIIAEIGGQSLSAGLVGQYTCSDISIALL